MSLSTSSPALQSPAELFLDMLDLDDLDRDTLDQTTTQAISNQHHQPTMSPDERKKLLASYIDEDNDFQLQVHALRLSYGDMGYRDPAEFYTQRKERHDNHAKTYAWSCARFGRDPKDDRPRKKKAEKVMRQRRELQMKALKEEMNAMRDGEALRRRLVRVALWHFAVNHKLYTDASWQRVPTLAVQYRRDLQRMADSLQTNSYTEDQGRCESCPTHVFRQKLEFRDALKKVVRRRGWKFSYSLSKAILGSSYTGI